MGTGVGVRMKKMKKRTASPYGCKKYLSSRAIRCFFPVCRFEGVLYIVRHIVLVVDELVKMLAHEFEVFLKLI